MAGRNYPFPLHESPIDPSGLEDYIPTDAAAAGNAAPLFGRTRSSIARDAHMRPDELIGQVREAHARRVRDGQRFLESRRPLDLADAMAEELAAHKRMFRWWSYGGDKISIPANQTVDIARTVNAGGYFVGQQILYASQASNNVAINLVEAGGVELFRTPIPILGLNTNALNTGSFLLPRDWILSPGDVLILRAKNRSAVTVTLDLHVGGYVVYCRQPAISGRPTLGDFFVQDASGRLHVVEAPGIRAGGQYPGAGAAAPSPFPALELGSSLPRSVMELVRGIYEPEVVAGILEAYRNTFKPASVGSDRVQIAAGAGNQGSSSPTPLWGDSYFVSTLMSINNAGASNLWDLEVLESSAGGGGGLSLFSDPVDQRCFQTSGNALGTYYMLPQRYVLAPKDEIRFRLTNRDAANAVDADVNLLGYRVFVR